MPDYYGPGYDGHPAGNYPGLSPDDQRRFNDGRRQAEYDAQLAAQRRQQDQQREQETQQNAQRQREQNAQRAQQEQWQRDQERRNQQQASALNERPSPSPAVHAPWSAPAPAYTTGRRAYVSDTDDGRAGLISRFVAFVFKAIGVVVLLFVAVLIIGATSSSTPSKTGETRSPVASKIVDQGEPRRANSYGANARHAESPAGQGQLAPTYEDSSLKEARSATGESAAIETGAPTAPEETAPILSRPVSPPPAPELRITIAGNPYARFSWFVHFFDETTGGRWPANPAQAFIYSRAQLEIPLACIPMHVVCFGAWRADGGYSWGVGFNNNAAMRTQSTCRVCGPGVGSWSLPSPEPL